MYDDEKQNETEGATKMTEGVAKFSEGSTKFSEGTTKFSEGAIFNEFYFDDEFAANSNSSESRSNPNLGSGWTPKILQRNWFKIPEKFAEKDLDILRHCAFEAYAAEKFEIAAKFFEKISQLTSAHVAKSESLESLIRCLMKLKNFDDATKILRQLMQMARNSDERIQTRNLQKDLCAASGQNPGEYRIPLKIISDGK